RTFEGRDYVMERWIRADYALVKAQTADRAGNLLYNMSARNFGPIRCMAAQTTVVQVREVVEPGAIDPEAVVTPGIFVDRIVQVANPAQEELLFAEGAVYP
ncbi:MAG: CoA transferase subunit A, partial [Phycisphaerales bacterium JB037]